MISLDFCLHLIPLFAESSVTGGCFGVWHGQNLGRQMDKRQIVWIISRRRGARALCCIEPLLC